jgi:signal peptidase I
MPQQSSENFFTELLKFILVAAAIIVPIRLFVAQPFIVSGASMEPTFTNAQYLIVDELSYHLRDPERFEVVIFRYPRNPSEYFIKRVIGLPGETVALESGEVSVTNTSGQTVELPEPYVVNEGNGTNATYRLRSGEYFVMGDNRPQSSDSRTWGALPRENIVGRAFLRLLPLTSTSILPGSYNPQ